jgi:hypothetical protein
MPVPGVEPEAHPAIFARRATHRFRAYPAPYPRHAQYAEISRIFTILQSRRQEISRLNPLDYSAKANGGVLNLPQDVEYIRDRSCSPAQPTVVPILLGHTNNTSRNRGAGLFCEYEMQADKLSKTVNNPTLRSRRLGNGAGNRNVSRVWHRVSELFGEHVTQRDMRGVGHSSSNDATTHKDRFWALGLSFSTWLV